VLTEEHCLLLSVFDFIERYVSVALGFSRFENAPQLPGSERQAKLSSQQLRVHKDR
jgi:hypothetical protein